MSNSGWICVIPAAVRTGSDHDRIDIPSRLGASPVLAGEGDLVELSGVIMAGHLFVARDERPPLEVVL